MIFIGDVHAKVQWLSRVTHNTRDTIVQVGDLGVGFTPMPEFPSNFHFIRGNHDDPARCVTMKSYMGDYGSTIMDNAKIFFVGGADSVDKSFRIPFESWWPDEQIHPSEHGKVIASYMALPEN